MKIHVPAAVPGCDEDERLVRDPSVLAVVLPGGEVHPGDAICVALPLDRTGRWR